MEYTKEIRKKKFSELPADLKEAILSVETADKLAAIREKHSLMLDQAGELGDELSLLMLGFTPQNDFVGNLSKRLGVSKEKASEIAVDINKEILDAVRASLRKAQEESEARAIAQEQINRVLNPQPTNPPIAPIEKAGDFTVHQAPPSSSPLYKDQGLKREDVLADLENIKNLKPENAESYVEHLIEPPVKEPEPVSPPPPPPQAPPQPQTAAPEKKKYDTDPYREPV